MLHFNRIKNTAILLGLMLLIVSGCKKDDPVSSTDALIGTWKLTYITAKVGGATLPMTPEQAGIQMTIVVKADNTYSATIVRADGTTTDTGTWSANATQFTMKSQDGTTNTKEYALSGNKLVVKGWEFVDPTFGNVVADLELTKQ